MPEIFLLFYNKLYIYIDVIKRTILRSTVAT